MSSRRKFIVFAITVLLALLGLVYFWPSAGLQGKVVRVIDGDTLVLLTSDKEQVRVRLYGIDTPERGQPFGSAAKQHLTDICAGKTITVDVVNIDRYGRTIGVIYYRGSNINHQMVKDGYAWWYEQYAKNDTKLKSLQEEARKSRRGLWSDPHATPPWQWRKRER